MQDAKMSTQIELEKLYSKNQLLSRLHKISSIAGLLASGTKMQMDTLTFALKKNATVKIWRL